MHLWCVFSLILYIHFATCLFFLSFHHLTEQLFTLKVVKMNTTTSNNSMECVLDRSVTSVVLPCLYSVLFLVALVLNSLAAWIFYKIPNTSTFVVYLKNVVSEGMCVGNVFVSADI